MNPLATNKNSTFNWASIGLRKTLWSSLRSVGRVRTAQEFREDGMQDDSNAGQSNSNNGFGTFSADNISPADDVFVDNGEYDLDCPTEGFNSIAEAIEDIRQGKVGILPVDSIIVFAALALALSNFSMVDFAVCDCCRR